MARRKGTQSLNQQRANERKRLEAVARYAQALELRKAGATYQQIAQQLGYAGPGAAQRAVQEGLKLAVQEPAEEVLQLELGRLDTIFMTAFGIMRDPDETTGNKLGAIDRLLGVMDRRSRYLGLDAPEKLDIGLHGSMEHHVTVTAIEGDSHEYMEALKAARDLVRAKAAGELTEGEDNEDDPTIILEAIADDDGVLVYAEEEGEEDGTDS